MLRPIEAVGVGLAGRGRFVLRALADGKQRPAGQQLPKHDAGRVDVRAPVETFAPRLLGGEIADLSVDDPRGGALELQRGGGQAKVGELHLTRKRQQNVGGRDVSMDQVEVLEGVDVGETARELFDDVDGDVDGEGDAAFGAPVPDRVQIAAVHVLHGQKNLAVVKAGVEDRDQVAVIEPQHDHRFVAEAARLLRGDDVGRDLLDDAWLFEPRGARHRQVELSHTAPRERFQQHVGIEAAREGPGARHGGHCIPPGWRR